MKVVGRDKLDAFCQLHADARRPVANWLMEVKTASWSGPQDIKDRYSSASFLPGNQVVFNVKGNSYRLLVTVALRAGVVVVDRVGTHTRYDDLSLGR